MQNETGLKLYHATPHALASGYIEPRRNRTASEQEEGDFVFAAPPAEHVIGNVAAIYSLKLSRSWQAPDGHQERDCLMNSAGMLSLGNGESVAFCIRA